MSVTELMNQMYLEGQIFMNSDNTKSPWVDRTTIISNFTTSLTSILTLYLALHGDLSNLPYWFVYIPLFLLFISMIVFVKSQFSKIRALLRKRYIVKSHFSTLITLAQQFEKLTNTRVNDNMTYALSSFPSNVQQIEFAKLCEWVTINLITRLETSNRSFDQFKLGVHDLHALVHSYHRLYFFDVFGRIKSYGPELLSKENSKIIEVARESFSRYLERFQSFCEEINGRLNKKMFDYYFEKAKPL